MPRDGAETSSIKTQQVFSPLLPFEQRVATQTAVSRFWFVAPRPPRLNHRLHFGAVFLLLLTRLNKDNLQTVELLDEGQSFLQLSLTLRDLQGAAKQLHRTLALDVPLSRTQVLMWIQQSLRLRKQKNTNEYSLMHKVQHFCKNSFKNCLHVQGRKYGLSYFGSFFLLGQFVATFWANSWFVSILINIVTGRVLAATSASSRGQSQVLIQDRNSSNSYKKKTVAYSN